MLDQLGVVAHTFNLSCTSEFKVTLVHKASSRIARVIQKNPFFLKNNSNKRSKEKMLGHKQKKITNDYQWAEDAERYFGSRL